MAKKAKVQPVYNVYLVTDTRVGKMLGPHKVSGTGRARTVQLTEKQAKYWVDQGMIERL